MVGTRVEFEVESVGINHVQLRDLRVGKGIRIRRLFVLFYPDALLLRREVEVVKAAGVYIDLPKIVGDFSKEGEGKRQKERRPSTYPPFVARRIVFYGLRVVPSDSVFVSVGSGSFSYRMGGRTLKLTRSVLHGLRLNTLPDLSVDTSFGDIIVRRDTLYVRLSASGRYDTLTFALGDGRMAMWSEGDTSVFDYAVSHLSIRGRSFRLSTDDLRARWKARGNPGEVVFSVGKVVWMDTLTVEDLSGTAHLERFPSFRLDSVGGEIYGGRFLFSLRSDSLKVFRGEVRLNSVSPMGMLTVGGYAVFSLNLGDTSFVGAGHITSLSLRQPSARIRDLDVSVESRGLKRYDFNALGQFTEVSGYYDLQRDEGEVTFNLDRPLRDIRYGKFRLYTLSARGRARKVGDNLYVRLSEAGIWYLLYDTLRIDSLFVKDLSLDVNVKRPETLKSEGKVRAFYSSGLKAVLSASYTYSHGRYSVAGEVKTDTLGNLEIEVSGRIPDSAHFSRVKYSNRSVRVALKDVVLTYGDTIRVIVPRNPLFGGSISGEVTLVRDSLGYRFTDSSMVLLSGVDPTPVFGTFFPDLDVLVERLDLTVAPEGYTGDPGVKGEVRVLGFSYGDVPIDSFKAHYRVGKDVAGISDASVWLWGHPILIDVGRYYLPNSTLYIFARAEDFPTDPLLPFLLPDSSRTSFELAVSGKIDSPNVLGFLYWTAKSIDVNGNFIRRPKIYAVAEGNRIILPALKDTNVARMGRGRLRFNGAVRTDLKVESLKVELENAEVQADPDITAILSGYLNVQGDLRREVMVSGDLTADEVEFFKPLTEMASGEAQASDSKPVLLYDIHIYAPRRIFLNSTLSSQALSGLLLEIDAELSADINAQRLTPTLSSVSGTLSFLRGNVYIVDKVFRIDRGEILLYGSSGTVSILSSATFPRMNVAGSPDSIKVFVSIEGEIDRPTVRIWSQPYMATGDILALIVGESSILGFLSRGLKWGLNFKELSIRQTPTSYQLLFGTYITRRIYLKSTLSTAGDYNSIRTLYFVNPRLSIYGERVQDQSGERYGVGINFRIRF